MKLFIVATFKHEREGREPQYSAYLRDYHPSWAGCEIISVEAVTGKDAKKYAIQKRKERDEISRRGDA